MKEEKFFIFVVLFIVVGYSGLVAHEKSICRKMPGTVYSWDYGTCEPSGGYYANKSK